MEVKISLVLLSQLVRTKVSLRELGSLRSGVRPEGSGRVVESGPTDSGTLWVRQFAVRAYITLSPAFEVRTENMCIVRRTVTSPGTEVRDAVRMNTITSLGAWWVSLSGLDLQLWVSTQKLNFSFAHGPTCQQMTQPMLIPALGQALGHMLTCCPFLQS